MARPLNHKNYEDFLACDYRQPTTPLKDLLDSPALPAWECMPSWPEEGNREWLCTNDPGGKTFKLGKQRY